MTAIYNEIDGFAASWTRNLIDANLVAPGTVDERSITDLTAADVAGPGQRHFFSGIGGWSYALRRAGIPDDADVWTGSCPCQGLSDAGQRRGFSDPRHLWPAWFALIEQCRPPVILGEQVASRLGLEWLDLVFADLERCGYTVGAADLCAAGVGAPHIRQRLYFVAYSNTAGRSFEWCPGISHKRHPPRRDDADRRVEAGGLGDAGRDRAREHARELHGDEGQHGGQFEREPRHEGGPARDLPRGRREDSADHQLGGATCGFWARADWLPCSDGVSRPVEPGTFPLAHGLPARVGRLRGYGNAIVTEVAVAFIQASLDAIRDTFDKEI